MSGFLSRLFTPRHEGQGATVFEYGLVVSLASVVIVLALQAAADHLAGVFAAVSKALGTP